MFVFVAQIVAQICNRLALTKNERETNCGYAMNGIAIARHGHCVSVSTSNTAVIFDTCIVAINYDAPCTQTRNTNDFKFVLDDQKKKSVLY